MKKLKNINYKAFFIDHAEKIGFVMIALFALSALGMTSWTPYKGTPRELLDKVKNARDKIASPTNKWPQEKIDAFKVVDFNDQARQIFTPLQLSKYEYTTPLYTPLYRKKELSGEPDYKPVEFLIATPGQAVLHVQDAPTAEATTNSVAATNQPVEDPAASTGFRIPGVTTPGGNTGLATATPTPAAGHSGGGFNIPSTTSGAYTPPSTPGGGHADGGLAPGMDMYAGAGGMSGAVVGAKPRGVRYVAVRGVFPLQEQMRSYINRLHVTSAEAGSMFELVDFVLERQEAVAGKDPWSGKWDTVSVESALEVLAECATFDPDPVRTNITDGVITMPLPSRLLEYWGDDATHPRIKDFQLSPAEMEREIKLYEKVREEYEKAQPNLPEKPRRRGLAGAQADLRSMGAEMATGSNAMAFMTNMSTYVNQGGAGTQGGGMGLPDLQQRLSPDGRLLLFRYFDFDVQPGMAYRYRVKLKLRNPNFERPVDEVTDPSLVQGPERESPWSNITNPAVIPIGKNYFIKDVERDPYRDDKKSSKGIANINVYEWSTELGTYLNDTLKVVAFGQTIADPKKKTIVINPGTPSYEEKEIAMLTEDTLIDVSGDIEISADQHPDLNIKGEGPQRKARLGLAPEALVVTALGELKELNRAIDSSKEAPLEARVKKERDAFKKLKDIPKTSAADPYGGALSGAMPTDGMPTSGGSRRSTPRSNPRRASGSGMMSPESGSSGGPQMSPPSTSGSRPGARGTR